jgi:hypothetical protein
LLTREIAVLSRKLEITETERTKLKSKVTDLEQELDRLRPKTGALDETQIKFLKLLFERPMTLSGVAAMLNISKGMPEYHRDVLKQAEMISLPMIIRMGRENPYHLLPKGREYLVQNKLV